MTVMRSALSIIAPALLLASALLAAAPDEVLVVYNRDWTEDLPGTAAGQDSEEIARYYVRRHTEATTGRKPYLLGLSCRQAGDEEAPATSPLNGERLEEPQGDNYFGVVYNGKGGLPGGLRRRQQHYLLSNRIECRLSSGEFDLGSVRLTLRPAAEDSAETTAYAAGGTAADNHLAVVRDTPSGGTVTRTIAVDAVKAGLRGDLNVTLAATNREGRKVSESVRCFDPADFAFSRVGPDGRRDDQAYLDAIEHPIKLFLHDPNNGPDGRPLKDRILYIVLCYGLPRRVMRLYGIAQTAVAGSLADAGNLVDLGQRLETAYYDFEAVRPPRVVPVRLTQPVGHFQAWVPMSNYAAPFGGRGANPYMLPEAWRGYGAGEEFKLPWKAPPHFTAERRREHPKQFMFLCSRIDAFHPDHARHLIDAAEYAQAYLTDQIGGKPRAKWDGEVAVLTADFAYGAGELRQLGLPGTGEAGKLAYYFGRREGGGYLPGAVDWYVISANTCRHPYSQVRRMLRDQVTATAGSAAPHGGGGCAHNTTHGWWDGRLFYHCLFRGSGTDACSTTACSAATTSARRG